MINTLELVLVLLAGAVLVVGILRSLNLPPVLGYLMVGAAVGPHAMSLMQDSDGARYLAEFGVVFLMFTIGLEFSLPRLYSMKRTVFGLGAVQVLGTTLLTMLIGTIAGLNWGASFALGGTLAMSSTAILSKLLSDRLELDSKHGRETIGVLLFQDLAVVPLLILIPALAAGNEHLGMSLGLAALKAGLVLAVLLFLGQRLMRPWFHLVARQKSSELFMLNVLLITLGLAYLTELAGLSLALGAFLAGMLISETEYRYQVEDDIKPFRDMLMGLFFVTIGMLLDLHVVVQNFQWVGLVLLAIVGLKLLLIMGLGVLFGNEPAVALRTGLGLAQAGEFGFVLLAQAGSLKVVAPHTLQVVLAAMLISMVLAPFLIYHADAVVRYCCRGEWAGRAREVHDVAVRSFSVSGHVIVCGYGRSGQNLARFLEQENVPFIALDLDPQRVKAAAAAGESVVYGDAARREVLIAAGLHRAKAIVVTYADVASAMKILRHTQDLRPELPVIVRTLDDSELERLMRAGATEVVPEVLEGSLMLASHALMLLGIPLARVLKRIRDVREQRYGLFRGFFRGASDQIVEPGEPDQPRLHSVLVSQGAAAVGKQLAEMGLERLLVEVVAVRRRNIRGVDPAPETRIEAGDVLVLRGIPENLAAAEIKLLQG